MKARKAETSMHSSKKLSKRLKARRQSAKRFQLIEQLERREMFAADPTLAKVIPALGFFTDQAAVDKAVQFASNKSGSGGVGEGPEGADNAPFIVLETEPNNGISTADLVPLGLASGQYANVRFIGTSTVIGSTNTADEDYIAFDLRAGDIFDAKLTGVAATQPLLALFNSTGRLLGSTSSMSPGLIFPEGSPIYQTPRDAGLVSLHYVIDTPGRYYLRVADARGGYTVDMKVGRPNMESQPYGTKQVLFLDFDGAIYGRKGGIGLTFGPGSVYMPPLVDAMASLGLLDSEEPQLVDRIVAKVKQKFAFLINGKNGNFDSTMNPGDYGIEIVSSKDSPDIWGQSNVSRVIVGGTQADLAGDPAATGGLLGISESVDPGNYSLTETAVVMTDVIADSQVNVDVAGSSSRLELIAELFAMVISHEAGHFLGAWHQNENNQVFGIMDRFYDEFISSGSGVDQIYGTPDDKPLQFNSDQFSSASAFNFGGINNTTSWLAFDLSTGKVGAATLSGSIYNDLNRNSRRDGTEAGVLNSTVYADLNNNGVIDGGEPRMTTGADGAFSLRAPAGSYPVRNVPPLGYTNFSPSSGAINVTVGSGGSVSGLNFGLSQTVASRTGIKYNDVNGNGVRDNGEPVIPGVWFYLDLDGDQRIDLSEPSAVSGSDGSYKLNFPGAGVYKLREILPPGYIQTSPGGASQEYTVIYDGVNPPGNFDFGNQVAIDYGDAPLSYGNASAGFVEGLRLGANWDAESSTINSATANGDNISGPTGSDGNVINDEDGVLLPRPLVAGRTDNRFTITSTNSTGNSAYVSAWVDFNGDGDFGDAGEQIIANAVQGSSTQTYTFSIPANAKLGTTFARFRYSDQLNLGPTGDARSGEVEDYQYTISDKLEIAVDDQYSVARNSVGNSLAVLSNDFRIPGENLTIISVSPSSAGAVVQIAGGGASVTYTPPQGFVGRDSFTYTMKNGGGDTDTATVFVDVAQRFDDPVAVDDSFDLPTNSINVPLNVLANDIEGRAGALAIVSVGTPNQGGTVTIATGAQALRYTPARDFGGSEQFTYTVADSDGKRSTATVTIHTLPGDRSDDIVSISVVPVAVGTDQVLTQIPQGSEFDLKIVVDDLRYSSANPGAGAGLFAAYLDVLYSSGLVTTVAPSTPNPNPTLDFKATFAANYNQGKRGSALVPGLVNDFGAFTNQQSVNSPDPTELGRIRLKAAAPGLAEFVSDPADSSPFTDVLLWDTPNSPVPLSQVLYGRSTLEIVGNGVDFPAAVDDSFASSVPANSTDFALNVLANDNAGSTGVIRLSNATQPATGSVRISDNGTPANPADDRILYTPAPGFSGTEQFTYTITDLRGFTSKATVTLQVGDSTADDQIGLRVDVTDLNGAPISQVTAGSKFQLRGYVQDLRGAGNLRGVFAAYQDVLFDKFLVSPVSSQSGLGFDVTFGPNYTEVKSGDIRTTGIVNELGSVQVGNSALGTAEFLQFIVTFQANSVGTVTFVGDPADVRPAHDSLLFQPPDVVDISKIRYGFDSVQIVAAAGGGNGEGYTNPNNRFDVNGDGFVSPIDALRLINSLNSNGAGPLGGGNGEGETGAKWYPDVNSDGYLSPIDVLQVINQLNSNLNGEGEGEAANYFSVPPVAPAEGEGDSASTIVVALPPALVEPKVSNAFSFVSNTGSQAPADAVFGSIGLGAEGESSESGDLLNQIASDVANRLSRR